MAGRLRGMVALGLAGLAAGCGGSPPRDEVPAPTDPLPTAGLAGADVVVYPLTMIIAEEALGWESAVTPRREALDVADSVIGVALTTRAPEVTWVLPDELRRVAERAPGLLPDPDQLGTSLLRRVGRGNLPDPLRSQLRNLTGVAGNRWALIPASLFFFDEPESGGRAELTMVLADVRLGRVSWRTVARGTGDDAWTALGAALAALSPGLP